MTGSASGLQLAGAKDDHLRVIPNLIQLTSNRSDDLDQLLSDKLCAVFVSHLGGSVRQQAKIILDRFPRNADCSALATQLKIDVRKLTIRPNVGRCMGASLVCAATQTSQRTSITAASIATATQVAASSFIGPNNTPAEPVFCWSTSRPFPPEKVTRKAGRLTEKQSRERRRAPGGQPISGGAPSGDAIRDLTS